MKSNQSILKEINPEYSLEAEAPTLWPPNVNSQLTGKDPDAGKNLRARRKGDGRGWHGEIASLTQWTWIWANSGR